jgi:hypothetical protein
MRKPLLPRGILQTCAYSIFHMSLSLGPILFCTWPLHCNCFQICWDHGASVQRLMVFLVVTITKTFCVTYVSRYVTSLPDLTRGYGFATVLGQDNLFPSCCDKKGHWYTYGTFRYALSASSSTSSAATQSVTPRILRNFLNGSQPSALNLFLIVVGENEHIISLMTVRVKDCLCL